MRLIQSTGKKIASPAATTSSTQNFAANVIQGSDIVCKFSHYGVVAGQRITAVTCAGTAASKISEKANAANDNFSETWRATNVTGGSSLITITLAGTGHFYSMSAEEWRGLAAADQTGTGGPTASAAPLATAAGATAQADELAYTGFTDWIGTSWTSATPPTGYVETYEENLGTSNEAGSGAYGRLSAISIPAPAFATGASMSWIADLCTFRAYGPNHSLNYHFIGAGGSSITTPAMTFDTALTGSTMLACVARGILSDHASNSVTDNKSNTFSQQTVNGTVTKNYTLWPTSGTSLYAKTNFAGGSGHTVTAAKPSVNDEVTLFAVEVPGTTIQDMQWNEDTTGPTNVSATVTYTADAWLICLWSGDDGSGEANPAVSAGWQKLEWTSSLASNHVQFAAAAKRVTGSGTDTCTWTPSTSQGGQMYIIAIQTPAVLTGNLAVRSIDFKALLDWKPQRWDYPLESVLLFDDYLPSAGGVQNLTVSASGGIVFSGASTKIRGRVSLAAGGLTFSGTSAQTRGIVRVVSGGLVFGGAAIRAVGRGWNATGGLIFSGAATVVRGMLRSASGGITFGGTGAAARGIIRAATGGIVFGGNAPFGTGRTWTPAGGLSFSGAATLLRGIVRAGSGGLTLSGTGSAVRGMLRSAAGGIVFAGAATVTKGKAIAATGGLVFSGVATVVKTMLRTATGGLLFGGSSPMSGNYTGGGGGTPEERARRWAIKGNLPGGR